MRSRWDRHSALRTPSALARWAVGEVLSLLVSGFVAIVLASIACGGFFALAASLGAMDRPHLSFPLTGMLGCTWFSAMYRIHQSVREWTRPTPPPPPVEFSSGRSSPLYDRELDG